ncbi:MAG TPA: AAA family ATPase [Clostridia bacterium]|nr:AAA family ATPase [Clostridia bacterium]
MESNRCHTGRLELNNSMANTFGRLLRFYSACIEEEDLRSLTLKLTQHHHSLVSPWDDAEPLFYPEASEVSFRVRYESDRKLLTKGAAQAGAAERFFYGYPIFLDENDYITPLFITEVTVEPGRSGDFLMRPVDANSIQVNHHLFRRQHAQIEELQAIQDELEGEFGSFRVRLKLAFDYLGFEMPPFDDQALDPFPNKHTPRNSWVNRPILFRSERSPYTAHLRRELDILSRYRDLQEKVTETAVAVLLLPEETKNEAKTTKGSVLVEVLPLNEEQEKATRSALEAPLTVVTGPPGTGKSQVVVDILASCAYKGRAVLFASKNNKAVDVVRDRIRDILGADCDWTLRLGSRDKMDDCREEMTERLAALAADKDRSFDAPPRELLSSLDEKVSSVRAEVAKVRGAHDAVRSAYWKRRVAEAALPENWVEAALETGLPTIEIAELRHAQEEALALAGKKPSGFWFWLKRLFMGRRLWSDLRARLAEFLTQVPMIVREDILAAADDPAAGCSSLIESFQRLLSYQCWAEALTHLRTTEENLGALPEAVELATRMENLKVEKANLSKEILRSTWTARIQKRLGLVRHAVADYFDSADRIWEVKGGREWASALDEFTSSVLNLAEHLPVWIVTNLSVRRSLPLQPALFDLVIIDEASQCDIASALPLLFRARRAVIIGDPRQLRHISTIRADRELQLARENGVEDMLPGWSYIFRSIYDVAEDATLRRKSAPVFLAEHYRSHPSIIEFSNRTFYRGRLVLRTHLPALKSKLEGKPLGVFWHDVRGRVPESSRSAWNEAEVEKTIELFDSWWRMGLLSRETVRFGIVTPFRLQMERMEEAVRQQPWWETVQGRLIVGTAHRFQGDECDVMVFSPVVAEGLSPGMRKWVAETDQLLNVAITRARGALHVVGDLNACENAGGYLGEFARYTAFGDVSGTSFVSFGSPAEEEMADLLKKVGLWYLPQYKEGRYRFDFLVVSPLGLRYDLEVDGREHWTPEQVRTDEVRDKAVQSLGYRVLRVDARDVFSRKDVVWNMLLRLC